MNSNNLQFLEEQEQQEFSQQQQQQQQQQLQGDYQENNNFDTLFTGKLQEMQQIQQQKVKSLEKQIIEKNGLLQEKDQKFQELENDFNYNLQVIEQRDRDIEELVEKMKQLKDILIDKLQQNMQNSINQAINKMENEYQIKQQNLENIINELKEQKQNKEIEHQKQNDRILNDNENLYQQLNNLKQENLEIEKKSQEEILNLRNQITEKNFVIQSLERETENKKSSLTNWEKLMKEKIDDLQTEKQQILSEFQQYKLKHKQKLRELRETGEKRFEDLINENHDKLRKAENQIRDIMLERSHLEMVEKNLKQKLQEKDEKNKKDLDEIEKKARYSIKNLEEDKRQIKNDLEIREFHLKQLNEEKNEFNKKIEILQNKIQELEKQNQEFDKENKLQQGQKLQPIIEEKISKSMRIKASSYSDKQKQTKFSPKAQQKNYPDMENENNQEFFGDDDDQNEVLSQNYEKLFSEDQGPINPIRSLIQKDRDRYMANQSSQNFFSPSRNYSGKFAVYIKKLENDVGNYKILIENMTREMENVSNKVVFQQQEISLKNEEITHLRERVSQMQFDNMNLREKIMTYEKDKTMNFSILPEELGKIKAEIEKKDQEIDNLNKKLSKRNKEIQKLKEERETLIEISNNIRSKLQQYEDGEDNDQANDFDYSQYEKLQAQKEISIQRIQELEEELHRARNQIIRLKELDEKKSQFLEKQKIENQSQKVINHKGTQPMSVLAYNQHQRNREKTKSPPQKQFAQQNQKQPVNKIPKYDNFFDIDDFHQQRLSQFEKDINNFRKSIEDRNPLSINSQQKPIIQRGDNDPRDNTAQYVKVSNRISEGQQKIQDKLKQKQNNAHSQSPKKQLPKLKDFTKMKREFQDEVRLQNIEEQEQNLENTQINQQQQHVLDDIKSSDSFEKL
ncbi:hypothetical protein PPERSA_12426 [Pseudocohnilembus persalinus]|uniref:Uncharacterized protein n=1 Tax=Pseudocohnilembus persalinus TaxID=266149 RepID=A0A0V0QP14_PSEPJ|nr:hypothetical protein PPERSA_12426 [Pseudocohnilembus persalinus]|eukprot:KRX03979.1 hypothetical protein PPERSA_12426 [Pseudocohnilembus persalinus]